MGRCPMLVYIALSGLKSKNLIVELQCHKKLGNLLQTSKKPSFMKFMVNDAKPYQEKPIKQAIEEVK